MRPSSTPPDKHIEDRYRARLTGAILFSLLVHGLLLSMQFGIPGIGLPSLELPWRDRRVQAIDLQVVLADAARAPDAAAPAERTPPAEVPASSSSSPTASGALKIYRSTIIAAPSAKEEKRTVRKTEHARPVPRKAPSRIKREKPVIALDERRPDSFAVATPSPDQSLPVAEVTDAAPALADAAPALPESEPAPLEPPAPVVDVAAEQRADEVRMEREREALEAARHEEAIRQEQREAERETRASELRRQADESARRAQALALQRERDEQLAREQARERDEAEQRALELQAMQREEARLREAARAEREALELQARKLADEAARRQSAAVEKQREEALARERDEARKIAELEAKRREDEQRLEAARREREAKELNARRQAEEAERERRAALERQRLADEQAARQRAEADMARQRDVEGELARGLANGQRRPSAALPRDIPGGGLAGKALEQARRSDIFRSDVPPRAQDAPETRRRSILGSTAQDVGLMMYVEAWKLKIERNGNLNYQASSAERARDPIVTVAIRSDGSVESVTIERSSGRTELDEAVLRIVRLNARYSAFPPELARRFDVIEIRRIWNFDERLRILEEVR